jgi:hypothetical protein
MNAFFGLLPALLSLHISAQAADAHPIVAGPWTVLRQSPVFDAEPVSLSKVWGPSLPISNPFQIEKVYGRWIYGIPTPSSRMSSKEYAKAGWVYSRMLLVPGDRNTMNPRIVSQTRAMIFHSHEAWRLLGLNNEALFPRLDFLESLVLSENTLRAFEQQDEAPLVRLPSLIPSAHAEEATPTMGLTGTDLGFLEQEFKVIQIKKQKESKRKTLQRAHAPKFPPLNDPAREQILGRFMLHKYFEFPAFSHEEIDGFIYMKAIATRALRSCPQIVREYWSNRPWNFLRVTRLKSRPEEKYPWLQFKLPGGYFPISARAIDVAGNEAELAFILVRALVEETRLHRKNPTFSKENWPKQLEGLSEMQWEKSLYPQSTKSGEAVDVAHDIAVDTIASECLSRAGYRPISGLSYLRKLWIKKETSWTKWFFERSPGIEYRLDKSAALLEQGLSQNRFPEGKSSNVKRFATASRYWNLMP